MNGGSLPVTVEKKSEAEFKEFETRLKHGWLKLYSVFQDLSRRSIGTGFWRFSDVAEIL